MSEPYVITRLCRDCVDGACVAACPVDCIYEHTAGTEPNQLYIDPEECIFCSCCEPACPWEAIYPADEVPDVFASDIVRNARVADHHDEYSVPQQLKLASPSPSEVAQNKIDWGLVAETGDRRRPPPSATPQR